MYDRVFRKSSQRFNSKAPSYMFGTVLNTTVLLFMSILKLNKTVNKCVLEVFQNRKDFLIFDFFISLQKCCNGEISLM